jgi:hypothetical protein
MVTPLDPDQSTVAETRHLSVVPGVGEDAPEIQMSAARNAAYRVVRRARSIGRRVVRGAAEYTPPGLEPLWCSEEMDHVEREVDFLENRGFVADSIESIGDAAWLSTVDIADVRGAITGIREGLLGILSTVAGDYFGIVVRSKPNHEDNDDLFEGSDEMVNTHVRTVRLPYGTAADGKAESEKQVPIETITVIDLTGPKDEVDAVLLSKEVLGNDLDRVGLESNGEGGYRLVVDSPSGTLRLVDANLVGAAIKLRAIKAKPGELERLIYDLRTNFTKWQSPAPVAPNMKPRLRAIQ